MKDFKTMLIGFLLSTSIFLFMGHTDNKKSVDLDEVFTLLTDVSTDVKEIKKNQLEALEKWKIWK